MLINHLSMKSTPTTLTESVGKLLILFVIILGVGYGLYQYYQPLCEPCLPNTDCPPCIAKEQYVVMYLIGVIEVIILVRVIYLALKKENK